jgi:hypothetical protein
VEMAKERMVFFNSLPALYEQLKKLGREEEVKKNIENFLVESFKVDLPEKIERFLKTGIGFIPADMEYFKLYSELIQLYINGLFYSTIVLSGVLCERICYDILTKHKITINGKALTEKQISRLYKMNLVYLFELLYDWRLIKVETLKEMYKINEKRNSYVHPKRIDLNAKKDSLEMIKRITNVLKNEFEIKVKPTGTVTI